MIHIDSQRRPMSHTTSTNVQDLKRDPNESLGSISKNITGTIIPTNNNNQTGTPKTSIPVNNTPGKSLMKLFGGSQTKQTPSTNGSTAPGVANHLSELDLSYITSRLIVMKTPRENSSDVSSRSTAELVRELLDTKHPDSYMLYSLDQYSNDEPFYRKVFHNKVLDLPLFDENQSPVLIALLWFCQKITLFLLESPLNVVVLHCNDGKNQLAFGACSLLAYHKILPQVNQIVQYYELQRCAQFSLTMSQKRYIQYLCDLSSGMIEQPHFNYLILQTINLSPIPLVNRQKTSCRPFVDIYDHEHKKIFSTYQETAKLRVYSASDSICSIPIKLSFNGDLTIHITHATISSSRRTHEGGVRICEFTINSNFSTTNHPELSYLRNELDGIDPNEKCPTLFRVTLDIINQEKSLINGQDSFTKQLDKTLKQPLALFKDENEFKQKINDYETQLKQQNGDANGKNEVPISPSPVVHRLIKKDNSISPTSSNSSSPRTSGFSSSFSYTPSSPSSFINRAHNPFKQATETSPRSSEIPSPPVIEETTLIDKLLDIEGDISSQEKVFQRSLSSDTKQQQFNSSIDSRTSLLDDDFHFDTPDLQRNPSQTTLLPTMKATTIPKTEQKSSSSTEQPNTTKKNPDYSSITKTSDNASSSQKQSNPIKPKLSSKHCSKPKVDIYQYFGGIDGLKKDSKPQPTSPSPSAIGDIRKAIVSKDVDPTVFKVREWTEGKKRNLRSLLCSLSTVTWPECSWPGCQMNELLTHEQVKKVYRRAVLYIHPDKLRGDPNEPLAKLIFVELNEAWSQFEQESNGK